MIFIVTGGALELLAGRHFAHRRAFLRDSDLATGIIVGLFEARETAEASYFPTVRFRTDAGHEVTFQSETGTGHAAWQIGDTVLVRHRRGQPHVAEVASFAALWGPTIFFALLGLVFLFVGVGTLVGWLPVARG